VSTRAIVDQNTVAAEMQREMNRQLEELRRKNEEEINALREENQWLERQLSKIPNKGKNLTVMEKERAAQDEMNSG